MNYIGELFVIMNHYMSCGSVVTVHLVWFWNKVGGFCNRLGCTAGWLGFATGLEYNRKKSRSN